MIVITQAKTLFTMSVKSLITLFMLAFSASDVGATEEKIDVLNRHYEIYDKGPVFVVAHRGCWSAAPENSIASIEACIKMGVEVVEIDVQLTKDGELIVFHDTTVDRMTTDWGYVGDKTLAELKTLTLYERDGSSTYLPKHRFLTHHSIPTLAELFEAARGHLMINLEIKSNHRSGFDETYAAAVALATDMGMQNHILWKIPAAKRGVGGADIPATKKVNALKPKAKPYLMPIVWESERDFKTQMSDFDQSAIHGFEVVAQNVDYWPTREDGRIIGADQYRYMGIAVLPRWSAGLSDELALRDADAAWGKLIELGMDLIMTDRPEQLINYLEQQGLR